MRRLGRVKNPGDLKAKRRTLGKAFGVIDLISGWVGDASARSDRRSPGPAEMLLGPKRFDYSSESESAGAASSVASIPGSCTKLSQSPSESELVSPFSFACDIRTPSP